MCSQEKPSTPSRVLPLYTQEYYREFCRNAESRGGGGGGGCNLAMVPQDCLPSIMDHGLTSHLGWRGQGFK